MSDDNLYYRDEPMDGTDPATSVVKCSTTAGDFTMKFHRGWSPNGYDRAVELFERGYFDGSHFFRVVPKFLVQFGIGYSEDNELHQFADSTIPDDPQKDPKIEFEEGVISFAGTSLQCFKMFL